MKEIMAYETSDGKKFFEEESAMNYEDRLSAEKIIHTFLDKAKEIFKEILVEEGGDFYLREDMNLCWDGEEDIEDLGNLVGFLIDVALSHGGKTLEFMNYVAKSIDKTSGTK